MRENDGASPKDQYVNDLFASEDEFLKKARMRANEINPHMLISPREGKMLSVFSKMIQVEKAVEIGAFTGYSAIWLSRALKEGGHLWTCEFDEKHADLTTQSLSEAGLSDRTTVLRGSALEKLPSIEGEGPFDLVFIDADKGGYIEYLLWAEKNVRSGGLIIGDNTYLFGDVFVEPRPDGVTKKSWESMREFNRRLATSLDFESILLPTGEGMTLAYKK